MNWLPKERIVVPLDFSDFSMSALHTALELVTDPSHVSVIHVIPPLTPMEPEVIWSEVDDVARREQALEALSTRLSSVEYEGVQIVVEIGAPSREVARFAAEVEADLIVLCSHGRTGAAQILMGSVAEHVVRHAHCPVLVLRK